MSDFDAKQYVDLFKQLLLLSALGLISLLSLLAGFLSGYWILLLTPLFLLSYGYWKIKN